MAKLRIELHCSHEAHFVIKKPVTEQEKLNFSYVGVSTSLFDFLSQFCGNVKVSHDRNVPHVHRSTAQTKLCSPT